ncbi:hypothetical protein PCI56_13845 [Plesiomonas shigelloides subsp. oncorhynchi]|nr:hypothetical protein [Plesiomonas shigelloides]
MCGGVGHAPRFSQSHGARRVS